MLLAVLLLTDALPAGFGILSGDADAQTAARPSKKAKTAEPQTKEPAVQAVDPEALPLPEPKPRPEEKPDPAPATQVERVEADVSTRTIAITSGYSGAEVIVFGAIENSRQYQSLRDERDRIIQAQEDVRRQVARNLHDGTVQFLSAIAMGIDHMERLLDFKPEAARSELEALRDLTRQATQQARLALFELRPLILETQGLLAALEAYVQQLEGSEEFRVHLEVANTAPDVDGAVAATMFTIVQEAVNNVKKHASARDVWLRFSHDNGWTQIVVEDNGKGFDAEAVERDYDQRGSFGLLNMRERAELIDGYLEIESKTAASDHGTKVTLHVPILEIEDEQTVPNEAS
jgi:signal transduction histidine kinase